MVSHITRWTAPCGCCFELESDPDSEIEAERENRFLLVNTICGGHQSLKTKKLLKAEDKAPKKNKVLGLIDEAKNRNKERSFTEISKHAGNKKKQDELAGVHRLVIARNNEITEEWNELVENPDAFDSEVYEKVLKENQITENG